MHAGRTEKPHITSATAARCMLAVALALGSLPPLGAVEADGQEARLDELLSRLDNVAALYRDTALQFSCRERITFYPGTPHIRVYDLEYMYVYDKENGLMDYRTEIRRGRKKDSPPRHVTFAELDLPTIVLRAYSAIFVFERSKRGNYHYSIMRDEKVLGRDAVVIRFDAIPPYKPDYNDWFGSAWVDLETWQLLRVEAMKSDQHEERKALEADVNGSSVGLDRRHREYIIEDILTEFSVEQNGMRFPSRVVIRRSHFEVTEHKDVRTSKERQMYWIEQAYSNYRFYGVRDHEHVRDFVSGGTTQEDQ